ncbi:MAG: hypothetical protein P8X89_06845 [Reinekea sp.]
MIIRATDEYFFVIPESTLESWIQVIVRLASGVPYSQTCPL